MTMAVDFDQIERDALAALARVRALGDYVYNYSPIETMRTLARVLAYSTTRWSMPS